MKDKSEGYPYRAEEYTPHNSVDVDLFFFFLCEIKEPMAGDQDCYLLLVSVKKPFTTSFLAL